MKLSTRLSALALFSIFCWVGATSHADSPAPGLTLYVSPTGDDTKTGASIDQAFATLDRARDEIRKVKQAGKLPAGGISVRILGGLYHLDHTFELTADDSGTPDSPITYGSYQNQEVRLSGAQTLKLSDFKPVEDPAILARLDPAARNKVVCLSIEPLGLKHAGPYPNIFPDNGGIFELYSNGNRLPLSRWPNTGYTTMKHVVEVGSKDVPGAFEYSDDRPARWTQNPNVWLRGQWRVGWSDPAVKVASIDADKKIITFAVGVPSGIGSKYNRPGGSGKEPWCALNLLEEIDMPGEWALDFDKKQIYLWPSDTDPQAELSISQLDTPMIHLNGTSNVRLTGLTLECSLSNGIMMDKVDSCLVAGCTIKNLAKGGVYLDGTNSGVQSCDIHDVGEGCVYVAGGDKATLTPSKNFVVNNHLHHYGVLKHQYSAAVHVGYSAEGTDGPSAVGILVAHNLIHHAPRDGILLSGENNIFEYNEIYYCAYDTADTGAFYSALDWTIRGIIIRYNFIHDTIGGVNPDDGASGSLTYGNIFAGPRVGVWIASGPDHTVQNNIFVKSDGAVFGMDDRGISRGYATNPHLIKGVEAIHPDQAPWSVQFPVMTDMLANHPELPWRTKVIQNLIFTQSDKPYLIKMKPENQSNPDLILIKDNLVTAEDPGFVDAAHGNFALKPGVDLSAKIPGFVPIPLDKMGLYIDEYRLKLPTDDEAQRGPKYSPYAEDKDKNFGT